MKALAFMKSKKEPPKKVGPRKSVLFVGRGRRWVAAAAVEIDWARINGRVSRTD